MSETQKSWTRMCSGIFWAAILGVVIYLIVRNIGVVSNVALVLLGFGAVVLVHEFGHFLIAKVGGIKVEAFSIFMPPTLLGIRRTKAGVKFRVLPSLTSGKDAEPTEEMEETEYRIGLFPFGGYVKLLGQEDTGPVKQVDDPRSFANKPVRIRSAVIAAGVTFNVISAAVIFMIVFLVGIRLPPAVVGRVAPDSPAAKAGLQPGDEFIKIDGKTEDLDFSDILIAAALSNANEPIPVTVRRPDGSTWETELLAETLPDGSFREFGITQPLSLTIARIDEPNILREQTGLLPGDRVVAVNGRKVEHYRDFVAIAEDTLASSVDVTVERPTGENGVEPVQIEFPLYWPVAKNGKVESEEDLRHVYSMVPRLRVMKVNGKQLRPARAGGLDESVAHLVARLKAGDIILATGEVQYPTYKELREITARYEGKPLPIKVLRADANGVEQTLEVTVTPRRDPQTDRVVIGFYPALDAEHAVVAKTISVEGGPPALEIPRGARIVSVNGKPVSSFYEVIGEIRRWEEQEVTLEYQLDGQAEGGVTLQTAQAREPITVGPDLPEELIPFKPVERLYRADSPIHALGMGYRRTWTFIAQTYVTLKQLIGGLISPKNLMGPVGIITVSYRIVAEQPLVNYAYFLGLISATIAVINFLPLPPFDGGLIVLMLVEKVKGSALNERTQGIVAYAGWVLVLVLLIYVTFNDIVRSFFS